MGGLEGKYRKKEAARLLAWSGEQTTAGVWSNQQEAHAGGRCRRRSLAAFMGWWQEAQWKLVRSQLARECCLGCEAQAEGLQVIAG